MHKYFALAALAVLAACNGKNNYDAPKELRVDADRCVAVDVDTTRMVRLEASDSSRLFGIDRLLPIGGAYVVSSRSKLRAFDKATDVDAGGDVAMACAVAATVAFCGRSFFVSYSGLFVFARYYGEKHGV